MRILIFSLYYLPGYKGGGPIRSTANVVSALGDEFDFNIVTLDRDLGDDVPYQDISDDWHRVGKANVRYFEKQKLSVSTIRSLCIDLKPDVIYLNSFFDPLFTARVMMARSALGIPVILGPRGEFSPGALAQKSLKKKAYIFLWKLLGLYKHVVWHASNDLESAHISTIFPGTRVLIASDMGVSSEPIEWSRRIPDDPLQVCFLSRISPMKNLLGAIKALKQVTAPVKFSIYGPIDDKEYWAKCLMASKLLPDHLQVEYMGEVRHENVAKTMGSYDLFFLPTLGENYGHVIPEALGAGVPVLTSDQTPWRDLEKNGVGWALPLEDDFAARIDTVAGWSAEELYNVRKACVAYAEKALQNEEILQQNRAMFQNRSLNSLP